MFFCFLSKYIGTNFPMIKLFYDYFNTFFDFFTYISILSWVYSSNPFKSLDNSSILSFSLFS